MIYHVATKEDWLKAQKEGIYTCASLGKEGFIHCSSRDQVIAVANYLFKGRVDLFFLQIDEKKVTSRVVFEDLKGHGTYPHIYGKINLDAIVDFCKIPIEKDGSFRLPENLR